MNISHLRRSLLALSVTAATVHAAPDLNHDLGTGAYISSGGGFNNATFTGTSQNAGVTLTNVTLAGSLINQGKINLTAATPSDVPSGISMTLNSTVAGSLVNQGDITVSGTTAMGLDLYLAKIAGEVSNNGKHQGNRRRCQWHDDHLGPGSHQ